MFTNVTFERYYIFKISNSKLENEYCFALQFRTNAIRTINKTLENLHARNDKIFIHKTNVIKTDFIIIDEV